MVKFVPPVLVVGNVVVREDDATLAVGDVTVTAGPSTGANVGDCDMREGCTWSE